MYQIQDALEHLSAIKELVANLCLGYNFQTIILTMDISAIIH